MKRVLLYVVSPVLAFVVGVVTYTAIFVLGLDEKWVEKHGRR